MGRSDAGSICFLDGLPAPDQGVCRGAKYKSFDTREEAERALACVTLRLHRQKCEEKNGSCPELVPDTLPASVIDNEYSWQSMLRASGNPGPNGVCGEYTWQAARKFFISAR